MKASLALRWEVRSARLTALHGSKPSVTSWWELLHGVRAINRSKRGAVVEESGLNEGQNLLLSDQPGRFDVVVTPGQAPAGPESPIPSIGTLGAVTQRMEQLASKLTALKQYPAADRLAFGLTLFRTSFHRGEALKTLAQVFPEFSRELKSSTDFVFQISHSARIVLENISMEIHYLQKWYFAQLKLSGGTQSGPIEAFGANVDLDISTGLLSDRRLSASEASGILPYLIQGADRILEAPT
jgi:hypothetical protein